MAHGRHQRYWRRFMLPGEKALHTFSISRWYLFVFWVAPALVTLGLAGYVTVAIHQLLGAVLFLIPLVQLLFAFVAAVFTHYVITNHRVMGRVGVFHKRLTTVDLRTITDVHVHEGFFERILAHTGVIGINTAGSDRVELVLHHVWRPIRIRQDIYQHQQALGAGGGQGVVVHGGGRV